MYRRLVFGRYLPFVGEFHTRSVRIGNLAPPRRYCPRIWGTSCVFLARAEMGWRSSFQRCSYDDTVGCLFVCLFVCVCVHITVSCVRVFRPLLLDTVRLLPFTFRLNVKLLPYLSTTYSRRIVIYGTRCSSVPGFMLWPLYQGCSNPAHHVRATKF